MPQVYSFILSTFLLIIWKCHMMYLNHNFLASEFYPNPCIPPQKKAEKKKKNNWAYTHQSKVKLPGVTFLKKIVLPHLHPLYKPLSSMAFYLGYFFLVGDRVCYRSFACPYFSAPGLQTLIPLQKQLLILWSQWECQSSASTLFLVTAPTKGIHRASSISMCHGPQCGLQFQYRQ